MAKRERTSAIDSLTADAASDNGGDSETVIDLVTTARGGDTDAAGSTDSPETETTVGEETPLETRAESFTVKTRKADLLKELDKVKSELSALKARSDTQAISELGAVVSMGVVVMGDFVAASRGSHWTIPKSEADPLGNAWAVVVAPYADRLAKYLPTAIALALSWRTLQPRLAEDRRIADAKNAGADNNGADTPTG